VAEPILPVPLFGQRAFAISVSLAALGTAGFFATLAFLPLYLQGVLNVAPAKAGQALTAVSLGWVAGATVCGRLLAGWGFRRPTVLGTSLIALAYGAFYVASASRLAWPVFASCVVLGIGMGFVATATLMAIQASAPRGMLGAATSGSQLFRTIGGTLGISLFGGSQLAFFTHGLAKGAQTSGDDAMARLLDQPHLILDPATRLALPEATLARAVDALAQSMHQVFFLTALCSLVGIVLAWRMPVSVAPPVTAIEPHAAP
jgi:MFS family permease